MGSRDSETDDSTILARADAVMAAGGSRYQARAVSGEGFATGKGLTGV